MSTLRNPVGPKGKNVYLRRRILVLAGLLAVIAVVVLIIVKPGSSGGAAGSAEVKVPDDLAATAQQSTKTEQTDEVPQCGAGQLAVEPRTDRESYAAGENPQLFLTVTNTGQQNCTADLGTAGMTFEVSSGDDQVWKASDCQKNPDHRAVILEPGKALETEPIVWDRTRSSAETCDIVRDPVVADGASYHLRVSAAGVQGTGTAQFLLY